MFWWRSRLTDCQICKHSALCLPLGIEQFFRQRFDTWAKQARLKRMYSKFELMTYQGNPDVISSHIEQVYKKTAAEFTCEVPRIRVEPKYEGDLCTLVVRFSSTRRVGYKSIDELPLELTRRDLEQSL